ncbi:MAG: CARDB domain-containing protein [Chloroflexota bacterium]
MSVSITSFSIDADGRAVVTFKLANAFADVGYHTFTICINNANCVFHFINNLAAGSSIDPSMTFATNYDASLPVYVVSVTIDNDNRIAESNEDNNVATATCKPQTLGGFISKRPCR